MTLVDLRYRLISTVAFPDGEMRVFTRIVETRSHQRHIVHRVERAYNAVMWILQVVLATICLVAGNAFSYAQAALDNEACRSLFVSDDDKPSGPEISIVEVNFSGALQMPRADQDQIAASIKERTYGNSLDEVTNEALERVRAGWLDRGYFKVQVSGEAKTLTGSPASTRIAISAHVVDEGMQYRLGEITFKHNKAISDVTVLRGLFPIKDGDIFGREKIAKGLENLRIAYGELGYINFTSVPDTEFDDEKRLASLVIDADEGKQFHISSIHIVGLDESSRREILNDLPVGRVYSQRHFSQFLEKYSSVFKLMPDDPRLTVRRLNEREGTIAITLYACPCPVCY